MSTTSIEDSFGPPASLRNCDDAADRGRGSGGAADGEPELLEVLSLAGWPRLLLETLLFLALISILQHWFVGFTAVPGIPHPFWLPVLLASSQYGVSGGMIAATAASIVYYFDFSPQSGSQDFYAYTAAIAIQPAAWMATALVIGGLRNLHIHQAAEIASQFAVCRRRANILAEGLEQAAAEIGALEGCIATNRSSLARCSRILSKIDLSNRSAAAASLGELFGVVAGATTFTIYLRRNHQYVPVWAIEDDVVRSTKALKPLHSVSIRATQSTGCGEAAEVGTGEPRMQCTFVLVPPADAGTKPLAVIACYALHPSQDASQFRRRADELSRAFAAILSACRKQPSEKTG